jgi:hypothetical protein
LFIKSISEQHSEKHITQAIITHAQNIIPNIASLLILENVC